MFWVISVYFNIRNTLPKSGTFLLRHPVYWVNIPSFILCFKINIFKGTVRLWVTKQGYQPCEHPPISPNVTSLCLSLNSMECVRYEVLTQCVRYEVLTQCVRYEVLTQCVRYEVLTQCVRYEVLTQCVRYEVLTQWLPRTHIFRDVTLCH